MVGTGRPRLALKVITNNHSPYTTQEVPPFGASHDQVGLARPLRRSASTVGGFPLPAALAGEVEIAIFPGNQLVNEPTRKLLIDFIRFIMRTSGIVNVERGLVRKV
jgi:hypothetical protein